MADICCPLRNLFTICAQSPALHTDQIDTVWKTDLHRDPRKGSSGPDVDKDVGTFIENPSIPVDSVIEALRTDWGEDLQMEYSTTLPHLGHRNIHNPIYCISLSETDIL